MGKVYDGIPPGLAIALHDKHDLNTFIETGTYRARTSLWASERFERVFTIEGWEDYYRRASSAHKNVRNIAFLFGDSRQKLPKVLKEVGDEPSLIWLDAHYLGDSMISAGTAGECPLREELDAIGENGVRHFVVIDDVHCFMGDLNAGSVRDLWPTVQEIKEKILGYFPDYYFTTFEDVVIAVPPEARPTVDEYMKYPGVRIVVPTSNEYVHCMPPFAYQLRKHWPDTPPVTVVRYEKRVAKLGFEVVAIGPQKDYTWSSGLMRFLYLPSTPRQFIFMLEDYFLYKDVDAEAVRSAWLHMCNHPEVVKIDLSGDLMKRAYHEHGKTKGDRVKLVRADDEALYQTSIQAAIWNRDFMLNYLQENETPWQFERGGTARIIRDRKARKFPGLVLGTDPALLHYVNAVGGEGRKKGRWDHKKIPAEMWGALKARRLVSDG